MPALPPDTVTIRLCDSLVACTREDWQNLTETVQNQNVTDRSSTSISTLNSEINPFISHDYLLSCEDSLSACRATGWQPRHYLAEAPDGTLLGAMPAYLKGHSQGEYVFDHGWAEAWHNAGGRYYPKLLAAVPFTPATGPRLLVPHGPNRTAIAQALLRAALTDRDRHGLSSMHLNFCTAEEQEIAVESGYLPRYGEQFHWFNHGYDTFEQFLDGLQSRKRKLIRRERREALQNGISIEWLTGSDLTESVWDDFFAFYQDTGSRKWGRPYLTRAFYSKIGERMADRILLVMAKRAGRYIAGAINFLGSHALFGRHWGAIEHHPFLHFEVCYYQAMDYAIQHRLARVEAGAQGEHKIARGYEPVRTFSAHAMADPGFHDAVADFLRREGRMIDAVMAEQAHETPFNAMMRKHVISGNDMEEM